MTIDSTGRTARHSAIERGVNCFLHGSLPGVSRIIGDVHGSLQGLTFKTKRLKVAAQISGLDLVSCHFCLA